MKKALLFILLLASFSFAEGTFLNMTTTSAPTSVQPGNAFSIEVQLENWGTGSAKNIKVYPVVEAPFFIRSGDASAAFIELIGRRSLRAEFSFIAASDAKSALYPLKFKFDYETEQGARAFGDMDVSINVEGTPSLELLDVGLVPAAVKPGDTAKLVMTVKNIGTGAAKNIRAVWSSSLATVKPLGGDVSYAAELKPGNQLVLEKEIVVPSSTTAGTYSLPVTFSYDNEKNVAQTSLSRSANIMVSSDIKLKAYLSSTASIIAGKKGTATVTIANIGPSTAEYLFVTASSDVEITPTEDYIGNLKSDDFDSIEFSVFGAAGQHPLKLYLTYNDQFNRQYSEDQEVMVSILTAEQAARDGEKNMTPYYLGGIVLLAIGYHFSKKKKHQG